MKPKTILLVMASLVLIAIVPGMRAKLRRVEKERDEWKAIALDATKGWEDSQLKREQAQGLVKQAFIILPDAKLASWKAGWADGAKDVMILTADQVRHGKPFGPAFQQRLELVYAATNQLASLSITNL